MPNNCSRIRVILESFDYIILDKWVKNIVDIVKRSGANIIGVVPLPMKIKRFTVNRSPHIYKRSMEHFEQRIFKRLLEITSITDTTINMLTKIDLPSSVYVKINSIYDKIH